MRQKFFRLKPKYLLTYLCHQCELDFTSTELTQPECFYCGSRSGFSLLAKEELDPETLKKELNFATERMLFNLQEVYHRENHFK